jgi:hypothetical protein
MSASKPLGFGSHQAPTVRESFGHCAFQSRYLREGGNCNRSNGLHCVLQTSSGGGSPNTEIVARHYSYLIRPLNLAPARRVGIERPGRVLPGHLTGNIFGRSLPNMASPSEGGAREVPNKEFPSRLVPFCSGPPPWALLFAITGRVQERLGVCHRRLLRTSILSESSRD